jgi:transcriptional regulator with XRE-family HTH domain
MIEKMINIFVDDGWSMTFQQRLRWARKMRGFTIEKLAEQIGVAKSTYANYELSNREPGLATIQALAKVLDVSTDFLLGISDHPKIPPLETNARVYLQSEKIHWDGIQLEEEELKLVRDFLEHVIKERAKRLPSHPGDTCAKK